MTGCQRVTNDAESHKNGPGPSGYGLKSALTVLPLLKIQPVFSAHGALPKKFTRPILGHNATVDILETASDQNVDVAVALKWDGSDAPRVTAKGQGETAQRILALAAEHEIPLQHEQELVELLLLVDLDSEIPQSLYVAVAEIIALAYSLSSRAAANS